MSYISSRKVLGERLRIFILSLKLPQARIADVINVSSRRISNWFNAIEDVPDGIIAKLEQHYNLNRRWFFYGEGNMRVYRSKNLSAYVLCNPRTGYHR